MKKFLIAAMMALTAMSASAIELGINTTRSYADETSNGVGITVGQTYGKLGVSVGFDQFAQGSEDQNIFSLNGSYQLFKIGTAIIGATAGVAYLDNKTSVDGYAMLIGANASIPVTKTVSFEIGVSRLYGQDRVKSSNGNNVTAGLTYSF